ncbi:MAG TPA: HU family DNA-binding protein [Syntrophomonadaceae bacterium]|nr:HU family DNA-binding protein [Syntrophomonadaceae bacterium]
MNKTELVKALAEKTEMTQKDAAKALEAVVATIQETLAEGERVQIIGFGSFEVRDRKERKVISPATGEEILVPATKVPAFKAGKSLKEAVAASMKPAAKASTKKKSTKK